VRDGEILEAAAAGARAVGSDAAVTVDDQWHIGSLTKAMTATLAAVLVERGTLDWSLTVGQASRISPPRRAPSTWTSASTSCCDTWAGWSRMSIARPPGPVCGRTRRRSARCGERTAWEERGRAGAEAELQHHAAGECHRKFSKPAGTEDRIAQAAVQSCRSPAVAGCWRGQARRCSTVRDSVARAGRGGRGVTCRRTVSL
jgi:hypothetical protein